MKLTISSFVSCWGFAFLLSAGVLDHVVAAFRQNLPNIKMLSRGGRGVAVSDQSVGVTAASSSLQLQSTAPAVVVDIAETTPRDIATFDQWAASCG